MISERIFTVDEANALLPVLSHLVHRQLLLQSEIEGLLAELSRVHPAAALTIRVEPSDSPKVLLLKRKVLLQMSQYEHGWMRVAELGCVVSDPCVGMVSFYGEVEGRLVRLRWCYGEPSVRCLDDLPARLTGGRFALARAREATLN